jgi:3-hydroxybutyrate dehydrogenase
MNLSSLFNLSGKTALVTGSSEGLGLAMARGLAAAGAGIILNGRDEKKLARAAGSLVEAGHKVKTRAFDVADEAAVLAAFEHFDGQSVEIDILVNNAGIQFVSPIEEFPPEKWDQIIAINLSSAFHTIRAAVPGMKAKKWGRVINTASAHALVASPFKSAYVSAKHGIAGLTKTVALETATFGITSNAICPGYVWTPLVEKQIPDTMAARHMTREQVINDVLLDAQPTKQFVSVDEVAALAVYLAGDMARSITGSIISIDGGWTAA